MCFFVIIFIQSEELKTQRRGLGEAEQRLQGCIDKVCLSEAEQRLQGCIDKVCLSEAEQRLHGCIDKVCLLIWCFES